MPHLKRPTNYRRNPPPIPRVGPKVVDDVSGAFTYLGYTVIDEEGQRVDVRGDTYDVRSGREEVERP